MQEFLTWLIIALALVVLGLKTTKSVKAFYKPSACNGCGSSCEGCEVAKSVKGKGQK